MSIIRIGLSETKHFSDGYDAIFGKKKVQKTGKDASLKSVKKKTKRTKKK